MQDWDGSLGPDEEKVIKRLGFLLNACECFVFHIHKKALCLALHGSIELVTDIFIKVATCYGESGLNDRSHDHAMLILQCPDGPREIRRYRPGMVV